MIEEFPSALRRCIGSQLSLGPRRLAVVATALRPPWTPLGAVSEDCCCSVNGNARRPCAAACPLRLPCSPCWRRSRQIGRHRYTRPGYGPRSCSPRSRFPRSYRHQQRSCLGAMSSPAVTWQPGARLSRSPARRSDCSSPFLPHQAWLTVDAIGRTLYRLAISKRNLLEGSRRHSRSSPRSRVWPVSTSACLPARSQQRAPWRWWPRGGFETFWVALPFVMLWIAAPAMARRISESPPAAGRLPASAEHRLEPLGRASHLAVLRNIRHRC